jgi:anti-sigma28 factor (negative regulator of flagellin synthesis)
MTHLGELDAALVVTEGSGHDAFTGIQENSQVRLTHRDDGSFVTSGPSVDDTALETLGLSEERLARVRYLRAEIAGGRYFVASHHVAERLMDTMLLD